MKKYLIRIIYIINLFIIFSYILFIINLRYNKNIYFNRNILNDNPNKKGIILKIDKINLKLPVIKLNENYSNLKNNLVYYNNFYPQDKNIIFGHSGLSYSSFFNRLDELKIGDMAYIFFNNENIKYCLKDIFIVEEDNVNILNEEKNSGKLLLITCKKEDNTKRLVLEFMKTT